MSLFGAMTAGVSGLAGQGEAISVISDNLSNLNTIGYKANRTLFSQLVTGEGGGNAAFNAGGISSNVLRGQNIQGSLLATSSATDLAISGDGFFIVTSDAENGANTETFYTRAGAFTENSEGYLVTPEGLILNGWATTSDGTIVNSQNIEAIELGSASSSARATDRVSIGANLNALTTIHDYDTSSALSNDLAAIVTTPANADYVTDMRVYDSLGNGRDISLAFTKRADNLWDFVAYTDGSNIFGGTSGTNSQIGSGTLRFNTDGDLVYATGLTITPDWADGASDGNITFDFGDYTGGSIATGAAGLTYTDDVLDIALDQTFASGTYSIRTNSADATLLEFMDTDGTTVLGTATLPGTSSIRTLEFTNGGASIGVRMTLSANFSGPGTTSTSLGNIAITNPAALGTGAGTDGIIQLGSANNTGFINQTGFGAGTLNSVSVDDEGFVIGSFTNGETKRLYKLALAVFQDPEELELVTGSLLRASDASGAPLIKEAKKGGAGAISSGSLEQSTVDIAGEFTNMIIAQRAYQAGSTIISTVDQMLNELLNVR